MAFYSYLSTKIIIAFITKSYQDLFGVRSYINAEIKSPEFTKGSEVNRLLLATRYDFILAMGDDTTDDDMFKALPVTAVTVKIGTASESARYNLPVQTDTLPFLQRMTDKSVVKAALKSGLKGQLSSAIDFLKRIINH